MIVEKAGQYHSIYIIQQSNDDLLVRTIQSKNHNQLHRLMIMQELIK